MGIRHFHYKLLHNFIVFPDWTTSIRVKSRIIIDIFTVRFYCESCNVVKIQTKYKAFNKAINEMINTYPWHRETQFQTEPLCIRRETKRKRSVGQIKCRCICMGVCGGGGCIYAEYNDLLK